MICLVNIKSEIVLIESFLTKSTVLSCLSIATWSNHITGLPQIWRGRRTARCRCGSGAMRRQWRWRGPVERSPRSHECASVSTATSSEWRTVTEISQSSSLKWARLPAALDHFLWVLAKKLVALTFYNVLALKANSTWVCSNSYEETLKASKVESMNCFSQEQLKYCSNCLLSKTHFSLYKHLKTVLLFIWPDSIKYSFHIVLSGIYYFYISKNVIAVIIYLLFSSIKYY